MYFRKLSLALTAAAAVCAGSAQGASLVADTNTLAGTGATVLDFNSFDGYLVPQVGADGSLLTTLDLGHGITFSTVPYAVVGASAQDLGDNGLWGARGTPDTELLATPTGDGNFVASAFVTRRGEFGFSFAAPVRAVGAYFNQFQAPGSTGNTLELLAYDRDGNVLESFRYGVNTAWDSYNEGKFLGISRASADIYGFGVADGSFVMDNLTVAVPEPTTYVLMLAGLLAIGLSVRARQR
jgi:hypothetical protein